MKKLLGILVLSLLLSSNTYAGKRIAIYEGEKCIEGDCVNGYGVLEYIYGKNRERYEGNFFYGAFQGDGRIIDLDNDVIWEGEFKKNRLYKVKVLANYTSAKTKGKVIKIPLSVHILKISEEGFSTVVDEEHVNNNVIAANKIWKQANIVWDLKEINYVIPNMKNFIKNRQWVLDNCSSNAISCLKDQVKAKKVVSFYNKLLKIKSTRNVKAINVYYVPKMLSKKDNVSCTRCGWHVPTFKMKPKPDYKSKNEGYVILSGKNRLAVSLDFLLPHELGHALGLKHVSQGKYLMNGRGSMGYELDSNEVNSSRSYFEKYYKILN